MGGRIVEAALGRRLAARSRRARGRTLLLVSAGERDGSERDGDETTLDEVTHQSLTRSSAGSRATKVQHGCPSGRLSRDEPVAIAQRNFGGSPALRTRRRQRDS
jgi:hypothetical protein